MMDKEVQMLVVGVVGAVAILTVFSTHTDLAQVCVAGLIGFLGAKAGTTPGNDDFGPETTKNERIEEVEEELA
jgi:hypothetical protein